MQKNKEISMEITKHITIEIDARGNQATKFSFDLMQKNKEATKENAKEINIGENQAIKFSFDVNNIENLGGILNYRNSKGDHKQLRY